MPDREITLPFGEVVLRGNLGWPSAARGAVIFAHGSGSSRLSARNRFVASTLQQSGIATLLMDLLTEEEEQAERFTRHLRFDIELLAERLSAAAQWLSGFRETAGVPLGFFGASTGAAAALVAAAREPQKISAVVSRGGRPDLAGDTLYAVRAPTLLIVGEQDHHVLDLNRTAFVRLPAEKSLVVVPRATHLFEEPGTLEQVATLARRWFRDHFGGTQVGMHDARPSHP
jgi:putative phosphoribosyl transferase